MFSAPMATSIPVLIRPGVRQLTRFTGAKVFKPCWNGSNLRNVLKIGLLECYLRCGRTPGRTSSVSRRALQAWGKVVRPGNRTQPLFLPFLQGEVMK